MQVKTMRKKVTLFTKFSFEAAHHLNFMPEHHPCAQVHGHTYRVEVEVSSFTASDLGETGMVLDATLIQEVKKTFDHQDLNKVLKGKNPTAENIALVIWQAITDGLFRAEIGDDVFVEKVTVHEGDNVGARVSFTPSEQ